MSNKNVEYEELSCATINEQKSIVLSKHIKGGFTMAQKVIVKDGSKKIDLFLKNPFQIDDLAGLINLRNALNIAIDKVSDKKE